METMSGEVCEDCLMVLAGYSEDELGRDISASVAGLDRESAAGVHVDIACGEDCEGGFSWSPCQLCESHLAGDRHPVTFSWHPTGCVHPGVNHSNDAVTVHRGAAPVTYCGFHASSLMP